MQLIAFLSLLRLIGHIKRIVQHSQGALSWLHLIPFLAVSARQSEDVFLPHKLLSPQSWAWNVFCRWKIGRQLQSTSLPMKVYYRVSVWTRHGERMVQCQFLVDADTASERFVR